MTDQITLEPTKIGINAGMLWYEPDTAKILEDRIYEAAIYYLEKYGTEPKTVYLPLDCQITLDWLKVEYHKWIMKNHLWLG